MRFGLLVQRTSEIELRRRSRVSARQSSLSAELVLGVDEVRFLLSEGRACRVQLCNRLIARCALGFTVEREQKIAPMHQRSALHTKRRYPSRLRRRDEGCVTLGI